MKEILLFIIGLVLIIFGLTYILETESGTSLKASGWVFDGLTAGGSWNCKSRPRTDKAPTDKKQRYIKKLR